MSIRKQCQNVRADHPTHHLIGPVCPAVFWSQRPSSQSATVLKPDPTVLTPDAEILQWPGLTSRVALGPKQDTYTVISNMKHYIRVLNYYVLYK